MAILKKKRRTGLRMPALSRTTGLVISALPILLALSLYTAAEENEGVKEDLNKAIIVSSSGNELGSIDGKGNIAKTSGLIVGSVDDEGNIFNVSKINIGKVSSDGKVSNQSGTVLGSVNSDGDILNVSGTKVGAVKGEKDIKRIGAAARLMLLK